MKHYVGKIKSIKDRDPTWVQSPSEAVECIWLNEDLEEDTENDLSYLSPWELQPYKQGLCRLSDCYFILTQT